MTGKTHMMIGTASSVLIARPDSLAKLAVCIGIGAIGGVICDIDVDSSDANDGLEKILMFLGIGFIIVLLAEFVGGLNIIGRAYQNAGFAAILPYACILLILCIFGKCQPHRGFMHSILAVVVFSFVLNRMIGSYSYYFTIAMSSHIVIDLLNKKGEQLFFPWKKRFCLHFCDADGLVNKLFYRIGIIGTIGGAILCCILYIRL